MTSIDQVSNSLKGGKKLSAADIAQKTGLSTTTVYKNLSALGATNSDGKYSISGGVTAAKKATAKKAAKAPAKKAAPAKKTAKAKPSASKAKAVEAPKTNPK